MCLSLCPCPPAASSCPPADMQFISQAAALSIRMPQIHCSREQRWSRSGVPACARCMGMWASHVSASLLLGQTAPAMPLGLPTLSPAHSAHSECLGWAASTGQHQNSLDFSFSAGCWAPKLCSSTCSATVPAPGEGLCDYVLLDCSIREGPDTTGGVRQQSSSGTKPPGTV